MADGDITLVCPRGAQVGQTLLFRDEHGARFSTEVPPGVAPGMKFTAKRHRAPRPGSVATSRGATPMAASFRGRDGGEFKRVHSESKLFHRPPTPAVLNSARPSTSRSQLPSGRSLPSSRKQGSGRPGTSSSSRRALPPVADFADEPLGDQAWWEQWGFKGAMSEEKKRDYGNGVPKWSPYHRANDLKDGEVPGDRTNLPADAFWFQQWGFRTGEISEEKRRDYGYGVPMWSPYYRSDKPPRTAK